MKHKMKILLVTNYWHPWNTSGTFRWLHLSKHLDFDVLTSRRPNLGFKDETLPNAKCGRLFRFGSSLPAVVSGLYLSIISCFIRADKYIFTCPPEMLFVGAFINGLLGRQVYVDLRDEINRPSQTHNKLVPIYKWLFRRIEKVCVTMKHFDKTRCFIPHGYIDIKKAASSKATIKVGTRLNYGEFTKSLSMGIGIDFGGDGNFSHYTSSIIPTLRHLKNSVKGRKNLHPDLFKGKPESWEQITEKIKEFLGIVYCE